MPYPIVIFEDNQKHNYFAQKNKNVRNKLTPKPMTLNVFVDNQIYIDEADQKIYRYYIPTIK